MNEQKIKETTNLATNPLIWLVSLFLMIPIPFLVFILIYSRWYFRGEEFGRIRSTIRKYTADCNALNAHIEELRRSYVKAEKTDYGEARFENISKYKYQKKGFNAEFAPNIYDCSRQICGNARKQPFKYICKYFNIAPDEKTLARFEEVLNNFSAAEEGKLLLKNKKDRILSRVKTKIPAVIRIFMAKDLEKNLGFEEIAFNELYYPQFTFRYVSSGGNAGAQFTTTMDIPMLERFVKYLDENIKRRKSAAGQRALMTSKLRTYIKERDHYTCRRCGNSTRREANLLLEIDHIIPIARGGLTEESNLQTLCWKCNRSKGAKVM